MLLQTDPPLPPEIKEAALNGELVLFVGAGVSKLVGLPSWGGLAWNALNDLRQKELLNYSELEQLKDLDPKKQLSIAWCIAEENEYKLDLTKHLKTEESKSGIYKYLNEIGCVCVTTNYDELLNPKFSETGDGTTASVLIKRIFEKEKFFASHLDNPGTVIHLHGALSDQKTMVVTTKHYLEHYDHEKVQEFLGELFDKKIVLIFGLWSRLLSIIDLDVSEGRKLASNLCYWSAFIESIDDTNRDLLQTVAPYADEDHNSYQLLENLARISSEQPLEAQIIWLKMLEGCTPDYPKEALELLLSNMVRIGGEGERKAKEVVDAYLRRGHDGPYQYWNEIKSRGSSFS